MENEGFLGKVRSMFDRAPLDPQDVIYSKYRQLKRMPSGPRHAEVHKELRVLVLRNQDALYDLIFSETPDEGESSELLHFVAHSVPKNHHIIWFDFMTKVRERQDELPESMQPHLDWLKRVHGW